MSDVPFEVESDHPDQRWRMFGGEWLSGWLRVDTRTRSGWRVSVVLANDACDAMRRLENDHADARRVAEAIYEWHRAQRVLDEGLSELLSKAGR